MADEKKVQVAAPQKEVAPKKVEAKKAEAKKPEAPAEKFIPNFKRKYLETVAPAMFKEHESKSKC